MPPHPWRARRTPDQLSNAEIVIQRREWEAAHQEARDRKGYVGREDAARETLLRFRALQRAGARIVFGHDPGFWATVPQAPARLG